MFVVGMILIAIGLAKLLGNSAWIWIGVGAGFVAEGLFGAAGKWMGHSTWRRRG